MASISPTPKQQFFNGAETLSGGKLYTYLSGTTTPYPTYTTAAGDVEHTNPIILDSRGEASIYLDQTVQYRYDLYDANDEPVWNAPIDQINPLPDPIQPSGFYVPNFGPDSDQRSVDNRLQDSVHIKDFTLVCDGVTDEWEKFYDALTWCIANNRSLKMTGNCYLGSSEKNWPSPPSGGNVRIWSDGDAIISADPAEYFVYNTVSNITFENIKLESDTDSVFFRSEGLTNVKMLRCDFRNVSCMNASGVSGTLTNVKVLDCSADGWGEDFLSISGGVSATGLIVQNVELKNGVNGIDVSAAIEATVSGNTFTDLTGFGVQYSGCQRVNIIGNRFTGVSFGNAEARAIQHVGVSPANVAFICGNWVQGDSGDTTKAMISWGARYGFASGNYCTTTLHSIPAGQAISVFEDFGEVATLSGDTINARNTITGGQNYMLDVNSSNDVGTELKLRNTSVAGVALMRFQTTTTGFTVNDGSYISNVTGTGDLIVENKEAGFIKIATDGVETVRIGHNGQSNTMQVRSSNATATEVTIRNDSANGESLLYFQTAFTGYASGNGTVFGNVTGTNNFRISNRSTTGNLILSTNFADAVVITPSSITFNLPVSFVGGGVSSVITGTSATPDASTPVGSTSFRLDEGVMKLDYNTGAGFTTYIALLET